MNIERVNIGLSIEQKLNELGMSKSEFGRKIGVPQQNVNRILDKTSIDTDKLATISEASKCNFHFDCPMSKCLGDDSGIYYEQPISEMVRQHENHRKVKLTCVGYGGYNLTFHCDWYAVLDISITYR